MVISTNHEVCLYVVGSRHSKTPCRSKRALVRNHVRRLERIGASVTQQCISVCLSKQRTNGSISGSIILKTLRKPLTVSLNKKGNLRNSMPTLTVDKTFELQRELNFTQRQVLRLLRFARRKFTRGYVPPYLPSMMKLKR